MKKNIALFLLFAFPFSMFAGGAEGAIITVKGSDTMVILAQRWAELYMKKNPNITIQVTGGGSGTGIAALINGTTDICNASRPMKPSEEQKLKLRYGTSGVEIKAAKDGIAIYVNEKNPIKELTVQQIKDMGGSKNSLLSLQICVYLRNIGMTTNKNCSFWNYPYLHR